MAMLLRMQRAKSAPPLSSTVGHLDITFRLQVVESSYLVSVLFREAFNHPYISFFHLLVNVFSLIHADVHLKTILAVTLFSIIL